MKGEIRLKRYITVFGGSAPREGDIAYYQAYNLGKLLARKGYIVVNGGYIGTMDAVSKGARQSGGKVVGVTCDEIENWRPVKPNKWINEEHRFKTLKDRLYGLIELANAIIALPGGIGTLAEISVAWSQIQIGAIEQKPLILIGEEWEGTFIGFYRNLGEYINIRDRKLLLFCKDINTAVKLIEKTID